MGHSTDSNGIKPGNQSRSDECIMNTNDSSIVSKRSVEKLYYPNEPQLFRQFVKKFKRRSPLINRGYWLRMRAVEHAVTLFLDEDNGKRKVVVNLGCGYDPLAFMFLKRQREERRDCLFVDVDYPELMRKKTEMMLSNDLLRDCLHEVDEQPADDGILIKADRFVAIGCDLRDLTKLEAMLAGIADTANCAILFVAEVSITYMAVEAADSVIKWASSFNDARFCLLEQFLPAGGEHPFAQKMLKHFEKLETPLHAIHKYPNLADQRLRFVRAGWEAAEMQSLWTLWTDPSFLSAEERMELDQVEPFDEWEEFALFASHYFLLMATGKNAEKSRTLGSENHTSAKSDSAECLKSVEAEFLANTNPKGQALRRFGAAMSIKKHGIGNHGGFCSQGRSSTCDVYTRSSLQENIRVSPFPKAYMCHTITESDERRCLLVGGRTAPHHASSECWMYENAWERVHDLEPARYRHCAVGVRRNQPAHEDPGVLVFGGKTSSGAVLNEWVLWRTLTGWQRLEVIGSCPEPRFGASMATSTQCSTRGILAGGMSQDGVVLLECWEWELSDDLTKVTCTNLSNRFAAEVCTKLARFGAILVGSSWGYLMVGGVVAGHLLAEEEEILVIDEALHVSRLDVKGDRPSPLLVGIGACCTADGDVLLVGGGAVCFSFGVHWNTSCYTIRRPSAARSSMWHFHQTDLGEAEVANNEEPSPPNGDLGAAITEDEAPTKMESIERIRIENEKDFENLLKRGRPAIIEGLDLGQCVELWTTDYLIDRVVADRKVVVHSSPTGDMKFQPKNFSYVTMAFGEFLNAINKGEKLYLRSLSASKPAEQPANFAQDFPGLAADFQLPRPLSHVAANAHSSPLRLSGPVTMWLHYDVQANVLCQIRGRKRLILYPPSDVTSLGFAPGASSSSMNPLAKEPSSRPGSAVHPHEAVLGPGDVLLVPELWPHCAAPTEGVSVAVNVFFRSLDAGYAPGRDVYGNRDLQAYEEGRRGIDKIARAFDKLPAHVRTFYLERLAAELLGRARGSAR